jgi:O-antigen/teichoic acid export membrane protein
MRPSLRIRRGAKTVPEHTEESLTVRDIGKRAASGAAMLTGKGALQQVLGFVSTIVVTRLLVPDQVGVFAIATTISGVLWMIGGGQGIAGALIRRETPPDHDDLRAYVALQLVVMTTLAVLVAMITAPFGIVGEITAVMVLVSPITAFRGAGVVVLERSLVYQKLASAEMAELVVYYIWTVVTVILGWGVWGLATAVVARSIVGTTLIVFLAPTGIVWPRFDRRRTRALLGIGMRVQAVEVVAATRDQVLVLATASIGGVNIVAFWSIVLRILQAPGMLIVALLRVSFPAMSRIRSSGGDPVDLLRRMMTSTAIAFGALLAPLAASAPAFVPMLLGDRWVPAGQVLPLVTFGVLLEVPFVIGAQSYLWAIGDAKSPLRAATADAIVMTVVSLSLLPFLGLVSLAIGFAASSIWHAYLFARAVDRHTGVHSFHIVRAPIAAWTVATSVGLLFAIAPGPLVVRVIISCCVALGLYFGLLALVSRDPLQELARFGFTWIRGTRRKRAPVSASAA